MEKCCGEKFWRNALEKNFGEMLWRKILEKCFGEIFVEIFFNFFQECLLRIFLKNFLKNCLCFWIFIQRKNKKGFLISKTPYVPLKRGMEWNFLEFIIFVASAIPFQEEWEKIF